MRVERKPDAERDAVPLTSEPTTAAVAEANRQRQARTDARVNRRDVRVVFRQLSDADRRRFLAEANTIDDVVAWAQARSTRSGGRSPTLTSTRSGRTTSGSSMTKSCGHGLRVTRATSGLDPPIRHLSGWLGALSPAFIDATGQRRAPASFKACFWSCLSHRTARCCAPGRRSFDDGHRTSPLR